MTKKNKRKINLHKMLKYINIFNYWSKKINYLNFQIKFFFLKINLNWKLNKIDKLNLIYKNLESKYVVENKISIYQSLKNFIIELNFLEKEISSIESLFYQEIFQSKISLLTKIKNTSKNLKQMKKKERKDKEQKVKIFLKKYIEIYLELSENSDINLEELYELPYECLVLLCLILNNALKQKKYNLMLFIIFLFNSINSIYRESLTIFDNSQKIFKDLIELHLQVLNFKSNNSLNKQINNNYYNVSFGEYLSNNFLNEVESSNILKKVISFKNDFIDKNLKSILSLKDAKYTEQQNIFISIFTSSVIDFIFWIWGFLKIDGINILLTIEFLIYQILHVQSNSLDYLLGVSIFKLNKVLLTILEMQTNSN